MDRRERRNGEEGRGGKRREILCSLFLSPAARSSTHSAVGNSALYLNSYFPTISYTQCRSLRMRVASVSFVDLIKAYFNQGEKFITEEPFPPLTKINL